ncbi:MAG: hypothetical protein JWQ97_3720 [Phenylobacterium sp.]|nr:hypothetical protein [Phenylobacterium sp.]
MKFRKKPVVIDAVQWTGKNTFEAVTFIEGARPDIRHPMALEAWDAYCEDAERNGLKIRTLEDGPNGEAKHVASPGDWIIRGVQGEFYPCKPDIFAQTYEPAEGA